MKNIIETVTDLEPGQKIKIGCKEGTSYFFCGDRETFLENYETYNGEFIRRAHWKELSTERARNKAIDDKPTMKGYLRSELEKEYPHPSFEAYQSMIKGWIKLCVEANSRMRDAQEYRKNFVSLDKRKVVEERESGVEENVKVLIITGKETGLYWMMEEAKEPFGLLLAQEARHDTV